MLSKKEVKEISSEVLNGLYLIYKLLQAKKFDIKKHKTLYTFLALVIAFSDEEYLINRLQGAYFGVKSSNKNGLCVKNYKQLCIFYISDEVSLYGLAPKDYKLARVYKRLYVLVENQSFNYSKLKEKEAKYKKAKMEEKA
ncbi:hypothetical protein [Helicobacter sp. 11S02629-2]|uniref:hypothetical protein n=1 Tax=Helicobacter sp. 11S02629-2 TaxID=1476195 RepID=UPI00117AE29D|nr:hypothetical protein [Helicobacter sp. 11S02629-2]